MITLREFVEKINSFEHYRVYQPNRDCLIYESYFEHHSPYSFISKSYKPNKNYWENNNYSNRVKRSRDLDQETKEFLDLYGDYIVSSIECSNFIPTNIYKNNKGKIVMRYTRDETQPDREYLNCFNIFIIPAEK